MPTVVAQLSDPHIRLGPEGPPAVDALARAVAEIRALPNPVDAVVLTGDVTDTGHPDEYASAREQLAAFEDVPLFVLPGNHDAPEAFAAAFGEPRWAHRIGGLRLVGCDTTLPGEAGGALDVAWLADRLQEDRETPTIVALHHPPVPIGIDVLDDIAIRAPDRDALRELLGQAPNVARLVAGHVHRIATVVLGGVPVACLGSTNLQSELELGAREFSIVPELPPSVAFHVLLDSGELVTHVQPIARAL